MSTTRREFLKNSAAASVATAVGMSIPMGLQAAANDAESGWRWDKSVCRFCGTGCGIMVATKNDKIVPIKNEINTTRAKKTSTKVKGKFRFTPCCLTKNLNKIGCIV